jgi:Bardet-Biedl syndrome 4 protein
MYLAITLDKLDDFESACQAFEKALELEKNDSAIYLNYAIVLCNRGYKDLAIQLFKKSEELLEELDDDEKEPELLEQREVLADALDLSIE